MYVRPSNYRYPNGVRLPENYSGNTFRDTTDTKEEPIEAQAEITEEPEEKKEAAEASLLSNKGFGLRLGSLFGDNKKIGTEELLIIAIILLLAESDNNEDLILFLVLLFFIK